MRSALLVVQIIVSLLHMGTILLQARGTGLGSAWGGGGEMYRSKRGVERVLLVATVVLTVLFLTLAAVNFALR